jgi:hypothetical protein
MRKHNLQKVADACGIKMVGRGKGRSKVVSKDTTKASIMKFVKALTARCECCGRRLPVNFHEKKGHVCRKGDCTCK